MRKAAFLLVLCVLSLAGYSQKYSDALLNRLDSAITEVPHYDQEKIQRINVLHARVLKNPSVNMYNNFLDLYKEYNIFNYDSAYTYARRMQQLALQQNDADLIAYAKIKLGFILLSSGMFKEVFDTLGTINLKVLDPDQKAEYFTLMARCYYDLADYDHDDFYGPQHNAKGNQYLDSSLLLFNKSSFEYAYYNGLRNIRSGQMAEALDFFNKALQQKDLSLHQLALTTSTMSDIYIRKGQTDTAINLLVRAAIADIQSSTKETSAIFNLSSLLFKSRQIQRASVYIQKAVDDAVFYGARQRKVQLSAVLPLIEAEKISQVENQKQMLIAYSVGATFLLLVVIILAIIIFRQVNKLKLAKKIITLANEQQHDINNKLIEANKIKEEYIGYFFNVNSDFFAKIERFKKSVDQKISDRKFDEIKFLVNNINLKQEKEELLKNFDKVFLKLFPDFVAEFNSLFKKEDQIKLKDNELLSTDLRIFALMRMGIHDNEKIARILEYSVNTVYTYKTKIKNKSIVPNDEFEHRIMEIKTM
ncbi:MAG TPA: DUF6377 domain-containing protein [Puia sp.]|nr:DUF6377 domain-containing protein [Puia sp.]